MDYGDRIVNAQEIRVVGMSRSGNHAIIDWILAQSAGATCFLNCAEPGTNPFVSARALGDDEPGVRVSFAGFDIAAERSGRFSRKDLLLHSYEDTFLGAFGRGDAERQRDELVGRSRRRLDVLILRDPFNLFASRLASGIGVVSPAIAARIWCQHAREFLGLRSHLGPERVLVRYTDWVSDSAYRRDLAERLGLRFDDSSASAVATCAGGSSFDGTTHDGRAHDMALLERWRRYADDATYRSVFTPELVDLSQRVFGPIAGTEEIADPDTPVAA